MSSPVQAEAPLERPLALSTEAHRRLIGYLGLALPVLLLGLAGLRATPGLPAWPPLESVSAYYYSGAVGVFVGVLFGLALFLLTYQGYSGSRADRALGRIGALCAVCVALFPTAAPDGLSAPPWWSDRTRVLHYGAATLLFVTFILYSLWLFRRSDVPVGEERPPDKKSRDRIYLICGVVMTVCVLWAGSSLVTKRPIFWAESLALWAFAVSWLVKGRYDKVLASGRPRRASPPDHHPIT